MERLNTTKWNWWTRRVGGYTLLCVEMTFVGAFTHSTETWETVIGRRSRTPLPKI